MVKLKKRHFAGRRERKVPSVPLLDMRGPVLSALKGLRLLGKSVTRAETIAKLLQHPSLKGKIGKHGLEKLLRLLAREGVAVPSLPGGVKQKPLPEKPAKMAKQDTFYAKLVELYKKYPRHFFIKTALEEIARGELSWKKRNSIVVIYKLGKRFLVKPEEK